MKKIYIAGAYTKPDQCENTHNAIMIANKIVEMGFIPFVPHLYHLWHTITPKPYEFWTKLDNEWLKSCDALFRIAGESRGADNEERLAKELGIPIFYDLEDLKL